MRFCNYLPIEGYCRKFVDEMAARHRTRGVLASRALASQSTANASARDAPGTVLRQHRKSFVPNIATLPIRLIDELRKQPTETSWVEFKHDNYKPEMIGEVNALIHQDFSIDNVAKSGMNGSQYRIRRVLASRRCQADRHVNRRYHATRRGRRGYDFLDLPSQTLPHYLFLRC